MLRAVPVNALCKVDCTHEHVRVGGDVCAAVVSANIVDELTSY
jgi:hypothetical protein